MAEFQSKWLNFPETPEDSGCKSLKRGFATPTIEHFPNELNEKSLDGTRYYGDGQPPPLDRPPANETELRRLMDHLKDPQGFAAWLEWAMSYTDPAEGKQQPCPEK